MKINEVPQDQGMMNDHRREVCYAVDQKGSYVLTASAGWEPKNIANRQAWDLIDARAAKVLARVHAGKNSPLAYHMALHQMDLGLLANYVRIVRWKVWLHLKPGPFSRLAPEMLQRYADVFDISASDLKAVPAKHHSRSAYTTLKNG
jgi:hypothetical protein